MSEIIPPKMFKIPFPEPPTLEQHRAASAAWLSRCGPCLYENWPAELRALSFKTHSIELSIAERAAMFATFDGKRTEALPALMDRIGGEIAANFEGGAFARLSSRSPKDAYCETFRCLTGEDVIDRFAVSERILDDLVEYKYADHPCNLLLREWCDIPKHEEWRCFIRDRKIIGITQYFYTDDFSAIYRDQPDLRARLEQFLTDRVLPIMHIDTVVVDVWLRADPMVIEINPWGSSDPCLFTYADLDASKGEMRIVTPDPQTT